MQPWTMLGTAAKSPVLIIADHAASTVPPAIDLGIDPVLLSTHIAVDLGVAALTAVLSDRLGCPAILGAVSRLVVDLNRDPHDPAIIPTQSDGHPIPGNRIDAGQRQARIDTWWHPYHNHVADHIATSRPTLIVSLHSFTPRLASQPDALRPWDIGILYNHDDRAAKIALGLMAADGVCVGDQLPYSGTILNATMNRHAETNGIAYLGIEVRQDRIADPAGIAEWASRLGRVIETCIQTLSKA